MALAFSLRMTKLWRNNAFGIILLCWIVGLSVGIQSCRGDPDLISSLLLTVLSCRVSIVGLFCVLFLPLLLSALAVCKSIPALMVLTFFAKAMCFGFAFSAIGVGFANASWMVRIFLLFSDYVGIVSLFWFSLRHLPTRKPSFLTDLTGCACACFMFGVIDYWLISPFAEALING